MIVGTIACVAYYIYKVFTLVIISSSVQEALYMYALYSSDGSIMYNYSACSISALY